MRQVKGINRLKVSKECCLPLPKGGRMRSMKKSADRIKTL
jgi:hypothetical protein